MTKASHIQVDFSAGELSPDLWGRVDSETYKRGAEEILNYIALLHGSVIRRPGTTFVSEVRDSSKKFLLASFEFSTTQSYILEFSHLKLRFYRNGGLITLTPVNVSGVTQANPAVVTANAHGFANGDRVVLTGIGGMVELNGREFEVAGVTANTFSLKHPQIAANIDSTAFTAYTTGGQAAKVYEIATPYQESHLDDLRWTQSADIVFAVHPSFIPYEITRTGHTAWTAAAVAFEDGPYKAENDTETTITPAAVGTIGATVTLTASTAIFNVDWTGRHIRVRHSNAIGWGIVTSVGSTTVVNVLVMNPFGATTATKTWRAGVMSVNEAHPTTIELHQNRMVLGGYSTDVTREDLSFAGDFRNFSPTTLDGNNTITDAHAIAGSVQSRDVNKIQWTATDPKGLVSGTLNGEYLVHPNTNTSTLTPTDSAVDRYGSWGSASHVPVRAGRSLIFIQRSRKMLRETTFFLDSDGFQSTDISFVANHLADRGIKAMGFTRMPYPILWCVCDDGSLVGVTFERDATGIRYAWHQHRLGGVSNAGGDPPEVETLAVIPSEAGDYDELYLGVKRLINGRTVRTVERLHKYLGRNDPEYAAYFVDCGLSLDEPLDIEGATKANPVVLTITAHGLANGETIYVTGVKGMTQLNNKVFKVANVTANTIELNTTSGVAVDGLAYSTYASGGVAAARSKEVAGLAHLAGEQVDVLGDGAYQRKTVDANGKLTLGVEAGFVHVGLKVTARLKTLPIDALTDGVILARKSRTPRLGLKLYRSQRVRYGEDFAGKMFDAIPREGGTAPAAALPLFTGTKALTIEGSYKIGSQICIEQNEPYPGAILGVVPQLEVSDPV